jgi:hypothetical protein
MFQSNQWIVIALTMLFLHGCTSGVEVRVDYDPQENFSQFWSYAWAPPTETERQEKAKNSLIHERIQDAVDAHLTARGYTKVPETEADFLVTHTVTVERHEQVYTSHASVGYGRYMTGGGVGLSYGLPLNTTTMEYRVGTLVIDIIDARQKRLVWRGAGDRTLGEGYTPEKRIEIINTVVNEVLGRFPPTSKKPK